MIRRLHVLLLLAGLLAGSVGAQPRQVSARVQDVLEQAAQARQAGDSQGQRQLLEEGLAQVGPGSREAFPLYLQLLGFYTDLGHFARAAATLEKMRPLAANPGQEETVLVRGLSIYSALHDQEKVRQYGAELEALMGPLRGSRGWRRLGDLWQSEIAGAKANVARAQGHLEEAAHAYRACLGAADRFIEQDEDRQRGWFQKVNCSVGLIQMQLATGQLGEAVATGDQLRAAMDRVQSGRPKIVIRAGAALGQLAMEQGRLEEARRILLETLGAFDGQPEEDRSLRVAGLQLQLARLEMLQGRWEAALVWHERRATTLRGKGEERGGRGAASPDHGYTLIRLGRAQEALAMMKKMVVSREELFDENALQLWEARAFLGLAQSAAGAREEALQTLGKAMPRLLEIMRGERSSSDAGQLRTARLNWLLDGYLMLLSRRAADPAAPGAAQAMDEAFRMADLARGSTVQRALAAAASRTAIGDPELARMARQEQDLQREISAFAESIDNLLARGRLADQGRALGALRADLSRLRQQHGQLRAEMERRFPDYAALLDAQPVGLAAVQKLLGPDEALLAVYLGSEQSLVWAVPAQGVPRFASLPLTASQVEAQVQALRESLDPLAEAQGRLPPFRFDLSHALYRALLEPVEGGWREAAKLIVVPHGRLGLLPFGVLTTGPFKAGRAALPYSEMQGAPWLLGRVAISQLPAAMALPALRNAGEHPRGPRAFVGFGDPLFSRGGAATAPLRGLLRRRGVPGAGEGSGTRGGPVNFERLPPLPDTALEIREVARVLAADERRDIFLGERASEARVKQLDLAPYRVVMFATHGLVGGELPGVHEPALTLANPALSGDGEDGILTMEEILGLKLGADWVVLSACNTGAGDGAANEAVSGLGRAFFYSGARALLVTQWAVETESARLLTTDLFRRQAENPALSRAQALQQAALALMAKSAGSSFSYAHPMFWAPYTLVGDGG